MNMTLIPGINPAIFAKDVILVVLEGKTVPKPPDGDFYRQRAACFVSIKKDGELRGCIGTLDPAEPDLAREIIRNARSAAFGDPRFQAVNLKEFPFLRFSVDVLGVPERVQGAAELDCQRFGVIVSYGYRRGVLLPDLDGVESIEHQLAIACQKAGISLQEQFAVERFTVDRYHEDWQP